MASLEGGAGVIGMGAMGLGVARSLLRSGIPAYGCDVRPDVLAAFAAEGGNACTTPAELAQRCSVVIVLVVNAAQTEAVLFGENGAAPRLEQGSVVVASATTPPSFAEALSARLASSGILMLDAPVSGGAAKAAAGQLTIMSSGPDEAYARADAVLSAIAANVYRIGAAAGLGSKVKIVNQLLAGVHIAAMAEALALALREGVDPNIVYDVITHSAGNSWMFENRGPHILAGDFTPLSAVDIFVKDLGLVLDTARKSSFPLPLSAIAHQMFMSASAAGYGREDDSAVIKVFPGIELPQRKE